MMTSESDDQGQELVLRFASNIVASYVGNNPLPVEDLPGMLKLVHETLVGLGDNSASTAMSQGPAVAVEDSVTDDYLVCLEDGKRLKMLKRYLRSRHNLSPEEYRAKWGLPADYPMVAPNYAAQRSKLAKKIGLGQTGAARKAQNGK